MAFNSAAIEEFSDIWVFCEQREGKLMSTDIELISEGENLQMSAVVNSSDFYLAQTESKVQQKNLADMVQTKLL